jgi:asparagine synthase (glutamine-hydrolysing)
VSPLCDPELIRFGEWLPRRWRDDEKLPREWIRARGLPPEVVRPKLRENFVPVMQHALRQKGALTRSVKGVPRRAQRLPSLK